MNDLSDSRSLESHETIAADWGQVVRSPEQVALQLPIAGPTSRMLAYAIDYVLILMIEIGVGIVLLLSTPLLQALRVFLRKLGEEVGRGDVQRIMNSEAFLVAFAVFILLQLLIEWVYFIGCEMTGRGRSVGKAVVGLRVVRDGGLPISVRESLVRNLLRMVDILPSSYTIGLVSMLVSPDCKRLGDLAAGTIVVRLDRPLPAPPVPNAVPEEISRFRFERAQIVALGRTERTLLRQTLRRLETLPPERADAILAQTVEALRARIGCEPVPPEDHLAFLRALQYAARRQ